MTVDSGQMTDRLRTPILLHYLSLVNCHLSLVN